MEGRNLIFEIMFKSKLFERLDLSDDFYTQFNVQNKKLKKQVGLYEVEHINNPNIITVAINPNEYFEQYKNCSINKKEKGIRRDTEGMTLNAYIDQLYDKKILHKRFQIKHNAMEMVTVEKKRFASLNDKRFYFMGGIVSLPFGHLLLEEARKLKSNFRGEITREFINQLFDFIDSKQNVLSKCERLKVFQTILNQPPQLYHFIQMLLLKLNASKIRKSI